MRALAKSLLVFGLLCVATACTGAPSNEGAPGFSVVQGKDKVVVKCDGQLFGEYVFTNTSRPHCYPIYGPKQALMVRNWPMKDVPGEAHDHPHHKGLWFNHGSVNGIDFWSELPGAGKVLHQRFSEVQFGKDAGVIISENQWVSGKGEVICTDSTKLTFRRGNKGSSSRIIDFEITMRASHGPITFGDTKEGTMAIRIAESMRLKGGENKGHIVNSRGVRDVETWGKRAEWCDYYGPVHGTTFGIAIFDNPKNPRHPTWWHVRDYGLFAANPFGQHDFEKLADKNAGNFVVQKGSSVTFRYRILLHEGDERTGKVAEEWKAYMSQKTD